jgi:hypothetical protein
MGHIIGKDIYQKLGDKIDNLTVRTPFNRAFHNILKELFTEEQADVVVKMPFHFSPLGRIARITSYGTMIAGIRLLVILSYAKGISRLTVSCRTNPFHPVMLLSPLRSQTPPAM